jgi:hypothetical protein
VFIFDRDKLWYFEFCLPKVWGSFSLTKSKKYATKQRTHQRFMVSILQRYCENKRSKRYWCVYINEWKNILLSVKIKGDKKNEQSKKKYD